MRSFNEMQGIAVCCKRDGNRSSPGAPMPMPVIERFIRRRVPWILFLAVAVLPALIVLGHRPVLAVEAGQKVDSTTGAVHAAGTKTVTDCIGRKVAVPVDIQKIGCLFAFTGHAVAMMGRTEDIVAISKGLRRDVLLNRMFPSFRRAPILKSGGAVNIEELLRAGPDVLFVSGDIRAREAETEKLDRFHVPYLIVEFNSIEAQMAAITMMGKAIGAEERAARFNTYYRDCIQRVRAVVQDIPEGERIRVYHSTTEATLTTGEHSLPADWLEQVGVINVTTDRTLRRFEGKNHASIEQIMLWKPDVILANETGVVGSILNDRKWAAIRAVKDRRVHQMPIGISRWGHPGSLEIPLAILWTAKTVYPNRFPELDIAAETRTFYRQFFDYDLSDEMLGMILSGRGMRLPKNARY